MLRFHVESVWTYFEGAFPFVVVDNATSYKVHGRWHAQSWRQGKWDGRKRFRTFCNTKKMHRIPTGLLHRVTQALDEKNYPYELLDERDILVPKGVHHLGGPIRLDQGDYSYQAEAVDTALMHGRGTIKIPTGGGKTEVGAALIASYDRPTLWLTHRKLLLYQTQRRLAKRLERPIGIVGDGRFEPERITVAMIPSLYEHKGRKAKKWSAEKRAAVAKLLGQAEVVIGDEIHHLESTSWYSLFSSLDATHRFGLTATPCTDGAGMHIIAMTGGVIVDVTTGELIEKGVLVRPNIWFLRVDGKKLPKSAPYATVYSQGVVHSVARNERVCHASAIFAAEGKRTITLVRRINHGEHLADLLCRRGVRAEFLHGSTSDYDRRKLIDSLFEGRLDQIVAQAEIMGEGVDLPELDALINATGTRGGGSKGSSVEHEVGRGTVQFLGRLLRTAPGKRSVDYVDLADQGHKFLTGAARERVRTLEEEGYGPWIRYWSERTAAVA
jgi:superfamily II DNA or RNA helicase